MAREISPEHICRVGFIMSQDPADNSYVPFFIKVREKDIIYDGSSLPDFLLDLSKLGKDIELERPTAKICFTVDDWRVTASSDSSYEATKRLSITNGKFTVNEEDDTEMVSNVILPFITKNDGSFHVQCTITAAIDDVALANINVEISDEYEIDRFKIKLRNLIYHFDRNFEKVSGYINSSIYVTVAGGFSESYKKEEII